MKLVERTRAQHERRPGTAVRAACPVCRHPWSEHFRHQRAECVARFVGKFTRMTGIPPTITECSQAFGYAKQGSGIRAPLTRAVVMGLLVHDGGSYRGYRLPDEEVAHGANG